jgi:hypothetical protein
MTTTHTDFDIALGQILRLPCKFIKGKSDAQPIILKTIAQELSGTGKNILPVVVRLLGEDKYQAILNTQILDALDWYTSISFGASSSIKRCRRR